MRKKSLMKDAYREIQKSLGRFFSIMLIVALGVAFLAGIKVSSPMMKDTTDQYMDEYQMMDISVLSTLGIEKADMEAISKLKQVERIMGSYSLNMLARIEGSQKVIKVHSLGSLSQEDEKLINKPKLVEGRWPSRPNECLIDGTKLTRLPIQIGDTITLTTGTDEEVRDVLNNDTYTVVGVMNSPYYMHFERGTAEIGNGSVASYIYIPEENFKSDLYTELFITLKGAQELDAYSQAYTHLVDDFKAQLEPIIEERALVRYEKLLAEGKLELEEGEAKLLEEKAKANKELADAALELEKAEKEIAKRQQELVDDEAKANQGFKQAEAALKDAEEELETNQKEYEQGLTLFNAEKENIKKQLDEAKIQLTEGKAQLQTLKDKLQSIEEQLAFTEGMGQESLLAQKQVLEEQIASLTQVLQVNEEAYKKGLAEFKVQEETLLESGVLLEEGKRKLAEQKIKLKQEKEATYKTLAEGKQQLEEGALSLKQGKEKYLTSKEEAKKQFKEAEAEIAKGKEQLENLKEPKVYVLGREANYGFANYKSATETIERIGEVFPIFFFVVAALVCLTTMTRMVDEQRITMGTYKALGYSTFSIMSKYILYAGMASVLGSVLGIAIGFKVFPNTIYNAYGMMFTVPPILNKFYPSEALSAILAMVCLTVFAVVFTTIKELKEQPSELMRPKAPPAGKRILLERIPFIWRHMNFFQKVVARNIFRYKKKFFMTTIGIAGCTALLVAGLGLKESIISIVDRQYGDLFKYNLEVTVKEEGIEKLQRSAYIENFLEVSHENIKLLYGEEDRTATLRVIHDIEKFPEFIKLQERVSQNPLNLDQDGVILSEKLAKALNVQVGDTVQLENSHLEIYDVKVAGIAENYIGHYVYMSGAYAQAAIRQTPGVNQLLIQLTDAGMDQEEVISNELTQNEDITSFAFTTKHAGSFESMTASLDTVVIILIVSAALLAFVVLYNLTTINISERYREIATIKVLGFNDFKVSGYIYRENIMLTLIGSLFGLLLGKALFLFIIVTAEMDEMMFGREIYWPSYLTAVILTFIFAMLVNVMMHFKLQKIEMVESLKSVE